MYGERIPLNKEKATATTTTGKKTYERRIGPIEETERQTDRQID